VKTADITDAQVVDACRKFHEAIRWSRGPYAANTPNSLAQLIAVTGAPEKVAFRAMERAERRGLIEYGVSLATAWPV